MHTLFPAAEVDAVPSWVTEPCFEEAVQQATPATAAQVVGTFRRVSAAMRTRIQPELPPESPWKTSTPPQSDVFMPPWAANECVAQRRLVVAAARLALGDAAEATMIYESVQLSRRGSNRLVRVYADAHLVSIWSSAHAEYMAAIQAGEEEPLDPASFAFRMPPRKPTFPTSLPGAPVRGSRTRAAGPCSTCFVAPPIQGRGAGTRCCNRRSPTRLRCARCSTRPFSSA